MPRSLGPALLATLTATGCYTGLDGNLDSTALTTNTTLSATTGETPGPGIDTDTDTDTDPDTGPDPADTTDISITVVDSTGQPIAGARVHHTEPNARVHVHVTDGSGHLVLAGFHGTRQVVLVDGDGYAPATAVVALVPGRSMEARVILLRRDPTDPATFKNFDAGKGADRIDFGAVQVSIPANALVDPNDPAKIPVAGPVSVSVVPIDPTTDLLASPGPLQGLDKDGRTVPLRTLFMAEISVWQGSKQLQLHSDGDPDLDATIRYRLPPAIAAKYAASTIVPAWYFDFEEGLWIEDVEHDDGMVDAEGYWTATVSHFTPWNADVPIEELGCVLVTALSCANDPCEPAPYVPVTAEGLDFLVTEITEKDGTACLNVPANAEGKVYLGVPGAPKSEHKDLPATNNASCGAPGDCKPVALKLTTVCTKGTTQDCVYEGPPITNGVGMCRPPRRTCDGIAYGLCEGGHVPVGTDDGCTKKDIDCDGLFEPAKGCKCEKTEPYLCYDNPSQEHLYASDQCSFGEINCVQNMPAPACLNAQYPKDEVLNNNTDENCDGSLGALDGALISSRVYHGVGENVHPKSCANQQVSDVAAINDFIYIAGTFQSAIELGGCELKNNNVDQEDIFVAQLDKDLNCKKAFRLGVGNTPSDGVRLALAPTGELALLGTCGNGTGLVHDAQDAPAGELSKCQDDPQTMVAFFDQTFTFKSSTTLGTDQDHAMLGADYVDANAIAYSMKQGFMVTGGFTKAIHAGIERNKNSFEDIFVATYQANGLPDQFIQFGDAGLPNSVSWATTIETAGGKILLAGKFHGNLFFQGPPAFGGAGAFVARFAEDDLSHPQDTLRLGTTVSDLTVHDLAGDAQGQVFAAASFKNDVIIGEVNPIINLIHSGGGDGVLLPINIDFKPQQPIVFNGGMGLQSAHRVALNSAVEPHVAGDFAPSLTVQPLTANSNNKSDAFLVKHTAKTRDPLWIWHAKADVGAWVRGLAIDNENFSYVVGYVDGPSALGPSGWCTDGFIAKISY